MQWERKTERESERTGNIVSSQRCAELKRCWYKATGRACWVAWGRCQQRNILGEPKNSAMPLLFVRYLWLQLADFNSSFTRCASGQDARVAVWYECRICNREVAGSNLSLGYFAPRSTQRSIPPESVNEYQLRLGRQRQVWLIPIANERMGVRVKLWNPLRTRAIPERFCGAFFGDSLQRGAISSVCTLTFTFVTISNDHRTYRG